MRYLLLAPCLLLMLLCGCPSGQTGIYTAPVYLIKVGDPVIPEGPLTAGDIVTFSISWEDGRAPYKVSFSFDGGASPNMPVMNTEGFSETVTVTLVNETDAPVVYDGFVTVLDYGGDSGSAPIVFTVNPAS